ncbi:hypothetical protein VOA_003002 [Vibrio sp. RC586]|nr:hypothetical protein VOA_003002 [Vibrio sp. RC586]
MGFSSAAGAGQRQSWLWVTQLVLTGDKLQKFDVIMRLLSLKISG